MGDFKGDVKLFNWISGIFETAIKDVINLIFKRGVSMQWFLDWLHLDFVKLDDSALKPYDKYFVFYSTPTFNITAAIDVINERIMSKWAQSLFQNDQIVVTKEELSTIANFDLRGGKTIKESLIQAVDQVNYQKE